MTIAGLLRRVLQSVLSLWAIVTIVFFLSLAVPGDPASRYITPRTPPAVAAQLRAQYGFESSHVVQYGKWLTSAVSGDLGYSFVSYRKVSDVLLDALPFSLALLAGALLIEFVLGIAFGSIAAYKYGSRTDSIISTGSLLVFSSPVFGSAIILLVVFSYWLGWFPPSHAFSVGAMGEGRFIGLLDFLSHLALPSIVAALPGAAAIARYTRGTIAATLQQPYVAAARSLGLTEGRIFRKFVLRESLIPVTSFLGLEFGALFTGAIVTETVFAWPGLGRVMIGSVFERDYPVILGCTIIAGAAVLIGNLVADIAAVMLDPRMRRR